MAEEHAVPEHAIPEKAQEKIQGDKLEKVLDSASSQGTGLSQEPPNGTAEREPAEEPLK